MKKLALVTWIAALCAVGFTTVSDGSDCPFSATGLSTSTMLGCSGTCQSGECGEKVGNTPYGPMTGHYCGCPEDGQPSCCHLVRVGSGAVYTVQGGCSSTGCDYVDRVCMRAGNGMVGSPYQKICMLVGD